MVLRAGSIGNLRNAGPMTWSGFPVAHRHFQLQSGDFAGDRWHRHARPNGAGPEPKFLFAWRFVLVASP